MHFLLAMRLIRHEARTFIIRQWTGLSDDRIRKLYRCYVLEADSYSVMRHRGKSPRQTAFFFRNPELCFQASQLASLFIVYGLLYAGSLGLESRYRLGSLDSGALLCQAYEAYIELHTPARISFEHAWFLLMALARREEIGAARCAACGGVRLKDLLAKRQSSCANCEPPGAPPPAAAGSASSGAEVDHACTQPGVRGLARYPANGLR
ncbi:MAG TPA: hypothetical protein VME42_11150 [Steroidobacteraceae bacterium]|nr:hypothetical protein [Steroidobacteraceae bacterium]